jgi:hypothetical protein
MEGIYLSSFIQKNEYRNIPSSFIQKNEYRNIPSSFIQKNEYSSFLKVFQVLLSKRTNIGIFQIIQKNEYSSFLKVFQVLLSKISKRMDIIKFSCKKNFLFDYNILLQNEFFRF